MVKEERKTHCGNFIYRLVYRLKCKILEIFKTKKFIKY